jgi:hypothetical protein
MNEFPDWLVSALASDASEGKGVLPTWIGSLKPEAHAIGPAFVVLLSQEDNLAQEKRYEFRLRWDRSWSSRVVAPHVRRPLAG